MSFFPGRIALAHAAALIAGAILPLAFAPFHFYPVAVISVAVLLWCLEDAQRGLRYFYLFYVGAYGVGVSWIYVSVNVYGNAPPLLAGFLVFALVLSWSLWAIPHGYLYLRFVRHWPRGLMLGFPALWVLAEWCRSWLLTGFPWLYLGTAHTESALVGYAPLGSVYAVSLVSAFTSAALYLLVRKRQWPAALAAALLWVGGALLWRIDFVTPTGQLDVAAVQGNVDQHTKWQRRMARPILERYLELSRTAWTADLIVWPEAAITLFREDAGQLLAELDRVGEDTATTLVLGIPDRNPEGRFVNSAMAVGEGSGTYHKRRLVPFGEYVPLEDYLRGLIQVFDLPMSHNVAGPALQAPLTAGDLTLSLSICYEVIYPTLVRSAAPAPDVLVTISNDTWFGTSIGPDQHLQMARMRAVENGRSLVRATNNGITVLADHRGRIVAQLARDEPGVLRGTVPLVRGQTPYQRFGQAPVLLLAGLALLAMVAYRYRGVLSFR